MEKNNESNLNWVDDRLATLAADGEWQPNVPRGLALLRERRDASGRRKRRWAGITAGAMATSLSLMAFPTTRTFAQRCVSACVNESSWVRQFLAGNISNSGPTLVYVRSEDRKMAPDFTLNDAAGKPVKLSEFRGKVVLLNFWATWCSPCKVEIPLLIGFQQTYRDRDFVVLGVSLDEDGWSSVNPYVNARKINYPVTIGNDDISRRYGGFGVIPTTLIIDRYGRIAATHLGLCSKSEYETDIKAVLNEQ